jgi:hypothetical protein
MSGDDGLFDPIEKACFDLVIEEVMTKKAEVTEKDIVAADIVKNYLSDGNSYEMSVYLMHKHWWNDCNLKNLRILVEGNQ